MKPTGAVAACAMLVALVGSAYDFAVTAPAFALAAQLGLLCGTVVAAFIIGAQVFDGVGRPRVGVTLAAWC
jgi:L-serine deaminase